ncbi:MAG: cytidylate kinase family protein [Deltaproteobacteria bacterium]|nr:cytidylate kinase family protein [Deltaproteobacteria bacterium]
MGIITISRQVGSLGDEIAQTLAKALGYKLIGQDEFRAATRRHVHDFGEKLSRIENENAPGFFDRLFFNTPVYQSLYESVVFDLAGRRQVIILGRGAQIVLKDIKQVFKVRITAPLETRLARVRQVLKISEEEAAEYVKKYDARRRDLVKKVFEQDPSNWSLYDLILNTEYLDEAAGVATIKAAHQEMMRLQPTGEAGRTLQCLALAKIVEARLRDEFPNRDIKVKSETDGILILTGVLPTSADRQKAEKIAENFPGILQVVNDLRTGVFVYGP